MGPGPHAGRVAAAVLPAGIAGLPGYHRRVATAEQAPAIHGAGARLRGGLIAAATILVILGISILPFLTPAFVRLEQDRVGVASLTGYGPSELDTIAGALLGDLVLWRGDFDVAIDGAPVLNEREREHLRDVRGVFAGLGLMVLAGAGVLLIAFRRAHDAEARAAVWRAVGNGARAFAVATAVLGVLAGLAFQTVFELFHRLFFTSGSYTFDPRTDRLVQLFPERFWSETTIWLGVVLLVLIIAAAWLSARRLWAARLAQAPRVAMRAA